MFKMSPLLGPWWAKDVSPETWAGTAKLYIEKWNRQTPKTLQLGALWGTATRAIQGRSAFGTYFQNASFCTSSHLWQLLWCVVPGCLSPGSHRVELLFQRFDTPSTMQLGQPFLELPWSMQCTHKTTIGGCWISHTVKCSMAWSFVLLVCGIISPVPKWHPPPTHIPHGKFCTGNWIQQTVGAVVYIP